MAQWGEYRASRRETWIAAALFVAYLAADFLVGCVR